uniref:Uncharacterized protein n=1 Tax=Strongyloides venezuelensis TaxID=75913 RepID=A0A0K0FWC6_STRVS
MLDTSIENTYMEVISHDIGEANEKAEDNIFDDLIVLENIYDDPHKKSMKAVLKYFSNLLNDNETSNKNLELYLQSHQEHGDDFVNEIKTISPFDPEETIFESIANVKEVNLERSIGDNKKNVGIPLQLYCDELNMNTFSNGLLQYLHVALRISGEYAGVSKIEFIYTVAILPTYKLNTINNSDGGDKNTHFFSQFENI